MITDRLRDSPSNLQRVSPVRVVEGQPFLSESLTESLRDIIRTELQEIKQIVRDVIRSELEDVKQLLRDIGESIRTHGQRLHTLEERVRALEDQQVQLMAFFNRLRGENVLEPPRQIADREHEQRDPTRGF